MPGEFKAIVEKAAAKAAERNKKEAAGNVLNTNPPPVASETMTGTLIKPTCQTISERVITWTWPWGEIVVMGILAVQDDPDWNLKENEYLVQLCLHRGDDDVPDVYTFGDDTAKNIAELLLSAHNWQYQWKQHAGEYLLKSLKEDRSLVHDYVEKEFTGDEPAVYEELKGDDKPDV